MYLSHFDFTDNKFESKFPALRQKKISDNSLTSLIPNLCLFCFFSSSDF